MRNLFFSYAVILFVLHPVVGAVGKVDPQINAHAGNSSSGMVLKILWTVSSYHFGKNADWGVAEAQNMLFKPLHVDRSSITFDGKSCQNITFQEETVDTEEYFLNTYQINPDVFAYNDDTVKVIKTNCTLDGFSEYVRLRDRRLLRLFSFSRGCFF